MPCHTSHYTLANNVVGPKGLEGSVPQLRVQRNPTPPGSSFRPHLPHTPGTPEEYHVQHTTYRRLHNSWRSGGEGGVLMGRGLDRGGSRNKSLKPADPSFRHAPPAPATLHARHLPNIQRGTFIEHIQGFCFSLRLWGTRVLTPSARPQTSSTYKKTKGGGRQRTLIGARR